MLVLGVDPGFASFGWALVELDRESERLIRLGVIRTQKASKKRKLLATEDNVTRSRKIHRELVEIFERIEAEGHTINILASESQSWPRSASVTAKVGMAWGVLSAFLDERDLALVQATPKVIKEAVTGDSGASKKDVLNALAKREGFTTIGEHLAEISATTQHEHPVDACAAVIACCDSPVIQMGRTM